MTQEEFAQRLRGGVVRFSFKKKNGEIRQAKGTLKMDLIPVSDHPKSEGTANGVASASGKTGNQSYYDLDKNAWRSFIWDNFCEVL